MRKIFDIFILVLVLILPSCMEEMAPVEVTGEGEGWLTINRKSPKVRYVISMSLSLMGMDIRNMDSSLIRITRRRLS